MRTICALLFIDCKRYNWYTKLQFYWTGVHKEEIARSTNYYYQTGESVCDYNWI